MKYIIIVAMILPAMCAKAQRIPGFGGITAGLHFNTHTTMQLSYMRGWGAKISDKGKYNGVLLFADAGLEFTAKDFIVGPKASVKSVWFYKISAGAEVVRYSRPGQQQWIIRPQIGLTYFGIAEIAYGYNFYEKSGTLDKKYLAPSHIVSLYIRLSSLLIMAKLYSSPQPPKQ
jgi:hypothetical protein